MPNAVLSLIPISLPNIVMDAPQTVAVCRAAPKSIVIATHMDSLDHATVSRAALRRYANEQGIQQKQLLIPADGDQLIFDVD